MDTQPEISKPLGGDLRVSQVGLIQHIQMGLACGDPLDLRVQAAQRDAGVQQLKDAVHLADIRFHHAQGLGHMTREPLNILPGNKFFTHVMLPIAEKG